MSGSSTIVGENENLDFVLLDTVRAVEQLRAEGRTVFLHCVQAYSRTPTISALYGARKRDVDIDTALRDVAEVLPGARPNADFQSGAAAVAPERWMSGRDRIIRSYCGVRTLCGTVTCVRSIQADPLAP